MGGGAGGGGFGNTYGGKNTKHGAKRMVERGFSDRDYRSTKKDGTVKTQSDGAKVYINEVGPGRFDVLVEGQGGPVTVFKGLSQKSVDRLAKNYGWR